MLKSLLHRALPFLVALGCGALPTAAETYTVTVTAVSGAGSLQQAILDANANLGADVIQFDVSGAAKTITPTSAAPLPAITDPVTIDGSTQPGFAGVPLIELNGSSGPAGSDGLRITASGCVVRGLVINRWRGNGIRFEGGSNNVVEGCFIGISLAGTGDQGNSLSGILLDGSAHNRIGGTSATQRNVIAGNEDHGIRVAGATAAGNRILGNYIGLNAAGAAALRNTDHGVSVEGAMDTVIGGTEAGAGNVISGNGQRGISLSGATRNTVIQGNRIGLDVGGSVDLGNAQSGVYVTDTAFTQIGGTSVAARNVISGNNQSGIHLEGGAGAGTAAGATVIEGNYIGLRADGTAGVGNSLHGINAANSVDTRIGGTAPGAGNVVSGNNQSGIVITGGGTTGMVIQGNRIGTDPDGLLDQGNATDGINVSGVSGNALTGNSLLIGGDGPAARNLIAGNNQDGIEIGGGSTNCVVEGNFIGTAASGTAALPNNSNGVFLTGGAARNRIGSVGAGRGNVIAFNLQDGVFHNGGVENVIRGNSIHSNGGLGIDLDFNGVTQNDATDADTGANLRQNFPVLEEAVLRPGVNEITGTLQSLPETEFILDFYSSESPDPTGNGEGQGWLGALTVTTDAAGRAQFKAMLSATNAGIPARRFVSATATDPAGNTSEFSGARRAVATADPFSFSVTTPEDSGPGSLRQAILDANAALNEGDRIVFALPGAGPHIISPATALPPLQSPVIIDGYTQAGAAENTDPSAFDGVLKVVLDGSAITSTQDGLRIEAPRAVIRGLNIIRFRGDGIEIAANSFGAVVEGNVIGLGLDQTDLGNNQNGVLVTGSAGHRIGGTTPAARNVLSGNGGHGVLLNGAGARGNRVEGNLVGCEFTGAVRVGNSGDGIHLTAAFDNRIGGDIPGAGNLVSGNNGDGVELDGGGGNAVQGNRVGVSPDGAEVRNAANGILINNSSDNLVGGPTPGAGNLVARNSGRGVVVANNASQRNVIRGNRIHANGNVGIDLANNGRTLNDAGDADAGPNGFQNFPELTAATAAADSTRVLGTLNGTAETEFAVEFFASREGDASGFGEGEQFLGATLVMTDAAGQAGFEVNLPVRVTGRFVTATATGPEGTSEFSAVIRADATIPPATFTVTTAADDGPGSFRQALLDADQVVTGPPHRIVFAIPGEGPHLLSPATALPVLANEPVEIDGFTQSGASPNSLATGYDAVHRIVLDGSAAPFGTDALRFVTSGNVVRGLAIRKFRDDAIQIDGNDNVIEGCLLGLAADGAALPNFRGIRIAGAATRNRIGGALPAERNVIAASVANNIEIVSTVGGNRVEGNFIGVLPAGNSAVAMTDDFTGTFAGVVIQNSPDNVVGGGGPGAGNVIGGHQGSGVEARDSAAAGNRILGNRIGTDATGVAPVPNFDGVLISNAPETVVGGPLPGEGNRVAFNRSAGVRVAGFSTRNDNPVRGNSITGNGGLGIELGFDGVQENDDGDGDDLSNRGQNFPVLTAASATGAGVTVRGTLNSVPDRTYLVDFYANATCDGSGNGEGDQYLGSAAVATGADGNGEFDLTLPVTVTGRFLTATATDPDGNTSEFCDCLEATTSFASETFVVSTTQDAGPGSLRDALVRNNASVAGANNRIEFAIAGDGPHVITPASPYPAITHAVTIDGFTQPGAAPNAAAGGFDGAIRIHLERGDTSGSSALRFETAGSIVRGLALTRWFSAVELVGPDNRVVGCLVGLRPDGTDGGNSQGISVTGTGNRIGGPAPADRNLIGFNQFAVVATGGGLVIQGNHFGLTPAGEAAANGLGLSLNGEGMIVGGSGPGEGNVIAWSNSAGVQLENAPNASVRGNLIGTDPTGLLPRRNGTGIELLAGAAGTVVGGTEPGARNVIGGSQNSGIRADTGIRIVGNLIGVGVDGATPLGNADGVLLAGSGNVIGGTVPAEGNVIAHNRGDGVRISGFNASRNAVRGNRLFANGALGINLGFDGVTANDSGDGDSGPNGLQNFPLVTAGVIHADTVEVTGTLGSAADTAFAVDLFSSRAADESGAGEGEQFLGSTTVTTGPDGTGTFSVTLPAVAVGRWISATATDPEGNTSELSPAVRAGSTRPPAIFAVTTVADAGPGSLRQALLDAGAVIAGTAHQIRFDLPSAGAGDLIRRIELLSPLPVPTEPVAIDGFSQAGAAVNSLAEADNAVRVVQLDGAGLTLGSHGIRLGVSGSSVRGLVITGFTGPAIELVDDGGISVTGCLLAGNLDGIIVRGSSGNRIGGTDLGQRNVILGQAGSGILITGLGAKENLILGNFVGLDVGGSTGGENGEGIRIESGTGAIVGGVSPGEANWIAFNRLGGVTVAGGQGTSVRGNRIFANGGLGIDLGNFGVNANDPGDADVGPNGLQNHPVVTVAGITTGGLRVAGSLSGRPGVTHLLDFYHSAACDVAGSGEGTRYVGTVTVTPDASGDAAFEATLAAAVPAGVVTATATDSEGNTSEFSVCREVTTELPAQEFAVTNTGDSGPGSLRQAILDANEAFTSARNTISFALPGTGLRTIQPLTPLPAIRQSVLIDGLSQAGSGADTSGKTLLHTLPVHVDGSKSGAGADGLAIQADDVTVRGLSITRFEGAGVAVRQARKVTLRTMLLGTTGTKESDAAVFAQAGVQRASSHSEAPSLGNGYGVSGDDTDVFVIGGSLPGEGVVIVQSVGSGAFFSGCPSVEMTGCAIGVGPDGRPMGNGLDGIVSTRGVLNLFGCDVANNGGPGVRHEGGGPFQSGGDLIIQNCDVSENGHNPGGAPGILVSGSRPFPPNNNLISGNRLLGNHGAGLSVLGSDRINVVGNQVEDNEGPGLLADRATDCRFGELPGAPVAADRNVIKGNGGGGFVSFDIFFSPFSGNVFGLNNLPVNEAPLAPRLQAVNRTVDFINVSGTVPLVGPEPPSGATLLFFAPVPDAPDCVQPGFSVNVTVLPDGTFVVEVPPAQAGNALAVCALDGKGDGSTIRPFPNFPTPETDVAVAVVGPAGPVLVGEVFDLRVQARASTSEPASGYRVLLRDVLPEGFDLVSYEVVSPLRENVAVGSLPVVTDFPPGVVLGESLLNRVVEIQGVLGLPVDPVLEVILKVRSSLPGTAVNRVRVVEELTFSDTNPANDSAECSVVVEAGGPPTDFAVSILQLPGQVPSGDPFGLPVRVDNLGSSTGGGAFALDLPPGLEPVSGPVGCEELADDERWIMTVYPLTVGRPPSVTEFAASAAETDGPGGRMTTATRLLGSEEYLNLQVGKLYSATLGRDPSPAELSAGVLRLQSGGGLEGITRDILGAVPPELGDAATVVSVVEFSRVLAQDDPLAVDRRIPGILGDPVFELGTYLEEAVTPDLVRFWVPGFTPAELAAYAGPLASGYRCELQSLEPGAGVSLPFQIRPIHPGVHVLVGEIRGGQPDPVPENNILRPPLVAVGAKDFGDAPTKAQNFLPQGFPALPGSYPTLAADNGASHGIDPDFGLGRLTDAEADGQPDAPALGDDGAAMAADDEDGVVFLTPQVPVVGGVVAASLGLPGELVRMTAMVRVSAATTAKLSAWVDFNRDGDWDDAGERVLTKFVVKAGVNQLSFRLPAALSAGLSYARFRLSSADLQGPGGAAPDGEVEDQLVLLNGLDRGDSPAVYGAAPHLLAPAPIAFLGAAVDADPVQFSADARADDTDADGDDEDGLTALGPFFAGVDTVFRLTASQAGFVDLWLDYNGRNGFELAPPLPEPSEYVNGSILGHPGGPYPVVAGANLIRFHVPDVLTSRLSFLRARYTEKALPNLGPENLAPDGEVEDYRVQLYALIPDFGDAPDDPVLGGYPTLRQHDGAFHLVTEDQFFLGARVDAEADGLPSDLALGDDLDNGLESPASADPDDEDGVTFLTPLTAGQSAAVQIVATMQLAGPAFVNAWVDFNGDQDWTDAGEQVLVDSPVVAGTNRVDLAVPASARPGNTFARFRLTRSPGTGPAGPATSGEVEDYLVEIGEAVSELAIGGITVVGEDVEVRWDDPLAVLESAPKVDGPWSPVPSAVSPFRLSISGGDAAFLRLVRPR